MTKAEQMADFNAASGGDETVREGAAEARPKARKGFAAMTREKVSEIASKGGKAAHAAGTAHQFTSEEAKRAGMKGGAAPHVRRGKLPAAKVPPAPPTQLSLPEGGGE